MHTEILIDGNNFDDLEGFYCEIDRVLTKDLTWKTGHNLNAFNDILVGDLVFTMENQYY
jgi:RNAse (barnase) inhibitor barstar